jgi:hypothetical protein
MCRRLLSSGVILLHDNTCLRYAAATIEAIRQLKI